MCSPSRATLLTGRYPAQHGVTLTHTQADLRPDLGNSPAVVRELAGMMRGPNAPRRRALRNFARGLVQAGPRSGNEPELRPETQSLAHLLRSRGYEVAYKGKWHLTHPSGGDMFGGWAASDADRLRDEYGFADWEPPDAGENAKAEHFGAGNAGPLGLGWDEVYTRQVESWLGRPDLPEPFCLVVSLVNPHDVLGYPAQHVRGGYEESGFIDLGVKLPPTVNESLRDKPSVHELMKMGMAAYLGPLKGEREKLEYVNFYAHLHRVVDEQLGRVMAALGDPSDPDSIRSRTMVFRCADHGEMGLSHGGLRQKAFNAYEETINIPLVVSNPVLFPRPARSDALVSLVDLLPTIATVAGTGLDGQAKGRDLAPIVAKHAAPENERLRRTTVDLGSDRRSPGRGGDRPGRDPLHVRRPSGGDGAPGRSRPTEPGSRGADGRRQVRSLLRSGRQEGARVRDVQPRAGSRREPQPRRPRHGRGPEPGRCRAALGARPSPRPPHGGQRNRAALSGPLRSRAMDRRVIGLLVA